MSRAYEDVAREPAGPSDSNRSDRPDLVVRGLTKAYGSNLVLRGVDLDARRGEILGLLGSNGAGKSTMLRIIAGAVDADGGELTVAGHVAQIGQYGPRESSQLGVHTVHQELSVFTNLSVAENFTMSWAAGEATSRRQARAAASSALEAVFPGASISPRAETSSLTLAERQMVEIAIAASRPGLSILIMDEPTSALPAHRAHQLHTYLHRLKRDGVLVIYVTHKLDEIVEIADRVVVLRDGAIDWEGDPSTVTRAELLGWLGASTSAVEFEVATLPAEAEPGASSAPDTGTVLLGVPEQHASARSGVRFRVHGDEVVGLAGLEGAGQRELLREIFADQRRRRSRFATDVRAAYVSGDRRKEGIFALWNVMDNIVVSSLGSVSRRGVVNRREESSLGRRWYASLGMVASGLDAPIVALSGGNQQKVVIARGMASGAPVVLLDDPTRGVDVETKAEFYGMLRALRDQGRAAVLYSTEDREFDECDRVYVMARGAIVKELRGEENTKENIIRWSYAAPSPGDGAPSASPGEGVARLGPDATSRAEPAGPTLGARLRRLTSSRLALVVGLLAVVVLGMGLTQPATLTTGGLELLVQAGLPLVCAALAQMFIILSGDFDVGVGYAIGLANVICATTLVTSPALGALMLVGLVAAYGAMAAIAHVTGVPAIVITLGASFVWLGAGLTLQGIPGGSSPGWLTDALSVALLVVPEPVYVTIGLGAVAFLVLRRWRYGTALRAYGNNPQAFADTGRSGLRARVVLYAMAGVFVVLGGATTTVVSTASDINASATLTLASVAAVVIGGAQFLGGVVEPVGAVLAAVALAFIPTFLYFLNVDPAFQTAVTGLILLTAMGLRRLARGGTSWTT